MTHTAPLLHRLTAVATVTAVMTMAAVAPLFAQTAPKHKSHAKTSNHRSGSRRQHLIALQQQSLLRQQLADRSLKRNMIDKNVIKPGKTTDRGVIKPRKTIDKGMVIHSTGKG